WIATIVLRTYQRYVRRNALRLQSEQSFRDGWNDVDAGSEDRVEARELLPQFLGCLKKRQLEMVLRHLRDGEPIDVISRGLGISTARGYKLLQSAIAKLKDAKRRYELIERRQLGMRGACMLPWCLSIRMETWIARARAWLGRSLQWAKIALGSGVLAVVLG